jgi:hypothetical protein
MSIRGIPGRVLSKGVLVVTFCAVGTRAEGVGETLPGPWVTYASRPAIAHPRKACSLRWPICVYTRQGADRRMLDVLASAEKAWEVTSGPLGLPTPDLDPDALSYPIFVVGGDEVEPVSTHLEARDVRSRVDRARAFTVVDDRLGPGCQLDTLMTRALCRASLYRAAPATVDATARAQTAALAELAVPCALGHSADAAATFQSRPERTVCDDSDPSLVHPLFTAGAALWWSRIDWAFGRSPGAIITATWALTPTTTGAGATRWHDEPDSFDVLRKTFEGALFTGSTLADLALDVAIARAFMGSAEDGRHQPETRTLGDAALVPIDWDLAWPVQPKRLAPRAPVAPLGASYLVVRTVDAPRAARLRVEIVWEEHALFRWAFVKIDSQGREMGRVVIPTKERATEAQMTLVDLQGVSRVLLVGANAGDPAYQFDPDEEQWEPHGWLVTIAAE